MKFCYSFFLTVISIPFSFGQCPDCLVTLPNLPEDTVYISDVADGQVGVYYDNDMSFRLPQTTTYADPTIDPALPISSITITSVSNLPPGLQWEASQLVFDTAIETDGCVKFCGTPLQADSFYVNVVAIAQVSIFQQETSFTLPFYIEPANTITEGFSMTNNVACGNTTVAFTNNVAANNNDGVSYYWDFGNEETSTDENPESVFYEAGTYIVTYEAVIDTLGYFLDEVTIAEASCTDLFGTPDIYIEVVHPNGAVIYTSETIDNTAPPLTFALPSIPIGEGNYIIRVTDVDAFAEVNCGNVTFNFATNGSLVDGDLVVDLGLINPMTMVSSQGEVTVYENPEIPSISPNTVAPLCENETALLQIMDVPNIQWYQDTILLEGENSSILEVTAAGQYFVRVMSEQGCLSYSDVVEISYLDTPSVPVFSFSENELTLFAPENLPADYGLQWYLNGEIIAGETAQTYCMYESGNYALEVTNNETGCTNIFSNQQIFFPGQGCAATSVFEVNATELTVYPNPTSDFLNLQIEDIGMAQVTVMDTKGAEIYKDETQVNNSFRLQTQDYAEGVYILKIEIQSTSYIARFVVFR